MSQDAAIEKHYGRPGLLDRILKTLAKQGIEGSDITIEALAPLDEFHVGGLPATRRIASRLTLMPHDRLVDLGCGTGGPARAIADMTGCAVSGVDLTEEFVTTGRALNDITGLTGQVTLTQSSILALPLSDDAFSHAMMLHVAMNVEDKHGLMREAFRILQPGGRFCVYDMMQVSDGVLEFPFPWAADASFSAVAQPADYISAAIAAGFLLEAQHDESAGAASMLSAMLDSGPANRPDGSADPFHNLAHHIRAGLLAPTEIYFRKPR